MLICSFYFNPAYCQTTWESRKSGTENDLHGIAYGNNLFVAVGNQGVILTSINGADWKDQSTATANTLFKVIYGGGKFVAVGDHTILTSVDGVEWTSQSIGSDAVYLREIAFGNGNYVAVGGFNNVLTSSNGTDWVQRSLPSGSILTSVHFDNGQFIVTGVEGEIYRSSTGINWSVQTIDLTGKASERVGLNRAHFTFHQSSLPASAIISTTSSELVNILPSDKQGLPVTRVGVNKGELMAIGIEGKIWNSLDGKIWEQQSNNLNSVLYDIAFGVDQYVIVGESGKILTRAKKEQATEILNFTGEIIQQQAVLNWNTDHESDANRFEIQKSSDGITYQPIGSIEGKGKQFSFVDESILTKAHYRIKATGERLTQPILLNPESADLQVINVFPNPSPTGKFYLTSPTIPSYLRIISPDGKELINWIDPTSHSIDLSSFASGVYFLQVYTTTGYRLFKLVKP